MLLYIISMFVLLGYGWVKKFPEWTIPSIGFCIMFSLYCTMLGIPNSSEGRLFGLWAFLPLILTLSIAVIFNPSFSPLVALRDKIRDDKSLILFSIYGFFPLLVWILADEIDKAWLIIVAIFSTIILSAGMYLYLRCDNKSAGIAALSVSSTVSVVIIPLIYYLYWAI